MIYIKYIWKEDPNVWSIWAHEKGSKEEMMIVDFNGNTHPDKERICLKEAKKYNHIKYLTKKEIDMIKLELL